MNDWDDDEDDIIVLQRQIAVLNSLVGRLFERVRLLEEELGIGECAP